MNLKAIKKGINDIKEQMGNTDNPTIQSFFKWCERHYYHRPVYIQELWFDEYTVSYPNGTRERVKSDMCLFLWLSHRYFNEIHNIDNPVKDGDLPLCSFKDRLQSYWFRKYKPSEIEKAYNMRKLNSDPDYTKWFNEKWDLFIETKDLNHLLEIIED